MITVALRARQVSAKTGQSFTMKQWATQDFVCAAQWLANHAPESPMVGLGHSFGGQALGLSGISSLFERYCGVAAMSGYWHNTGEPWGVLLKTQLVGVPISHVLGALPGWIGMGETMPGTIFRQWAKWVRYPNYFFDDPSISETAHFADVTLPLLFIGIEDDAWGTRAAVDGLFRHYTKAQRHEFWLKPDEESGAIGHLGLFRQRHRANHWPVLRDFLLHGDLPKGVSSPVHR